MNNPDLDDEKPLSPEQARIVARIRWLMLISGAATMLGIAVVLGLIGYRVFRGDGSVGSAEMIAMLPKGAKIASTAVADDRLVVTVDLGGSFEIRTFDVRTLRPTGLLRFASEP